MKRNKIMALVLALALVCTAFAGCGTSKPASSASKNESGTSSTASAPASSAGSEASAPTATGLYPGTPDAESITVNLGAEPPKLNTLTMTDTVSFSVVKHIMENLVMLDDTDNVIPGCAEKWDVSEDGTKYTFHLRDGLKWTNGDPVTAGDFEYAWKLLLNPDTASEYAYFAFILKNGAAFNEGKAKAEDVGVKAIDEKTLEVQLENATSYALNVFTFGSMAPVNKKFYEEVGADAYSSDNASFCTNGAYKVENWAHSSELMLAKNDEYWDAANISIPKIKMVMITDSNAAMNGFKAGEIDMIGVNGDQVKMMKNEGYPIKQYQDGSCFYLEFNTKQKGLDNVKVRQALGMAIDQQAFIDAILKNSSMPASAFTPGCVMGLAKPFAEEVVEKNGGKQLIPATADMAEAKKLLEEGLKESGMTVEEFGKTLSLISDDTDNAVSTAAFTQEQLRTNLGLEIKVESMPFKSRLERMTNKDFSMVFAGWGPDYNDANSFLDLWVTTGGNNHTGYADAEYDALIDNAAKELDPAKRMEYLYQAEIKICTDLPIYPVYFRVRDYIVSEKIDGGWRTMLQDTNFSHAKMK